MPKLTITAAVSVIPVSESTLRRDVKSGKVSVETDEKGRKRFDASELRRVYGPLKDAEPVNDTRQNASVNGHDGKVVALLQEQVRDLKAQLTEATTEKQQLLELANRLQKQNETLMLPPPKETDTRSWFSRLAEKWAFVREGFRTKG